MNPPASAWSAFLWPRDRKGMLRSLDLVLEFGLYLYVYTLFRATSLRMALTGILLVAWLARLVLDPGIARRLAAEPVVRALAVFLLLVLISVFYSPKPASALLEFATTLGTVGWLALLIPCAVRDERSLQRLLVVALVTALYLNYVQVKGIVNEYRETSALLADIGRHRSHTLSLMFFLPFVLVLAERARGKRAGWLWAAVTLQLVLLLATVGRAALLGTAVALMLWLGLRRRPWRLLIAGGTALALAGLLLVWLPENSAPWRYLQKGFSDSGRMSYTWGPTVYMIVQSPWWGHGYGSFVYPQMFSLYVDPAALADQSPQWVRGLGPHNYYLEIWFHAGVAALVAMIWLFARFARLMAERARSARGTLAGLMALAVLCAFVAHYLVHAHFGPLGPTGLRPLGFLLGLGIALGWITNPTNPQPRA